MPGWITLAALVFNVGWPTKAILGLELALSAIDPVAGFLAALAFAPLGRLVAIGVSVENFRMSEAVVLAFFVGWLLHGWRDCTGGPRMPRLIGPWLAAIAIASVAGIAWRLGRYPGELGRESDLLIHAYNIADDRIGVVAAARLVEGLALTAAAVTLFRRRPRIADLVPAALGAGGVAATASSWLVWYRIAPDAVLRDYARNGYRVVAHVADANAAGSAFAMLVCLSVGMALRARGRGRAVWALVAVAEASALWLSASRSALGVGAAGVFVLAMWWASSRMRTRRVAIAAVALLAIVGIAGTASVWRMSRDQLTRGSSLRAQFNDTSFRIIAERPFAGVGIGQYYRQSASFLTPQLAWLYGSENAHNYFLQIGSEIGLPGLVLFASLFVAALWRTGRVAISGHADGRLIGAACGVAAFLATALVSHPFLVGEVALPFWAQLGLVLGLADARLDPALDATKRRALPAWVPAVAVVLVVAAPIVAAWRGEIAPPASAAVEGFYGWETAPDGTRFRWTGEYASVFAPAAGGRVDIPVRVPDAMRGLPSIVVTPSVDGRQRPPIVAGPSWTTVAVDIAPGDPTRPRRVNLRVEPAWQPALHIAGSADMRRVGVQVGECRFGG